MAVTPHTLTLRCYGVGFGDCFLLSFHYDGATGDRHMLIDFGCTQKPPHAKGNLMTDIAKDIAKSVNGKLHVIVATHRHTDHISGFATNAEQTGTGNLIASLKPQLVIQPWTERLDAPKDWEGPKTLKLAGDNALRLSLTRMGEAAKASLKEARHLPKDFREEIRFLGVDFIGDEDLSNRSAVENLAFLGEKAQAAYVYYGAKIPALQKLLPGVKVDVLGPPTIAQKAGVAQQSPTNSDEYWNFVNFWNLRAMTSRIANGASSTLFPKSAWYDRNQIPIEDRWFVHKLKLVRGGQLLRIVRAMDDAMNNTSVILLMKAGTKKFLFPGDAQWENWEYALSRRLKDLKDVDVYKVGHHGSLNATPKTLWKNFAKKSEAKSNPERLRTVMSTVSSSKHGHQEKGTEVPREKLVRTLRTYSKLSSTQELEAEGGLVLTMDFDLR